MGERAVLLHHGGKWNMAKHIIRLFPEHRIYVEPFCGSCAVILQKPKSFVEVINDTDRVVVNIFEQLRAHPLELAAKLWAMPYAQANWDRSPEDGLEFAALEIAKAKQYYMGSQRTSTFSMDTCAAAHRPKSEVWADWHTRIIPAAARLKTVQIMSRDAVEVIAQFTDKHDAFIYIDPPYIGHEKEYRETVDYNNLIAACVDSRAKIAVSEFEAGAAKWPQSWQRTIIKTTGRSRTGVHGSAKQNFEYIITNYTVPEGASHG